MPTPTPPQFGTRRLLWLSLLWLTASYSFEFFLTFGNKYGYTCLVAILNGFGAGASTAV